MKVKGKFYILFFILIFSSQSLASEVSLNTTKKPYIQFLGAAQMVGGSCYLVDTGKTRFLIDFGLYYGKEYQKKNKTIEFDPTTIDFVLITHAHIDHIGRIPMLYRHGFKGKVIGTDATKSIAGVMLEMSLSISKDKDSIYGWKDYVQCMRKFKVVPYNYAIKLADDIQVRFRDAGHIMGSSIIEIWIQGENEEIKIVATGDMGAGSVPILRDPELISEGDYLLIESTYGSTERKPIDYKSFGRDIQNTINAGGSVLIPAFVLEKTQKIIYVIGQLKKAGIIAGDTPVYVDSSTGQEITKIYRKYLKYYNSDALSILKTKGDPLNFKKLYEVPGKISLRNHTDKQPAIYVTSSGMLDYANAPKHLLEMIDDPKNLLAIVGWQAPESLGRHLQEGRKIVEIPIEDYRSGQITYVTKHVKMKIERYGMFSSHVDRCRTLKWLSQFEKTKKIFVVHGEKESAIDLAKTISSRLGFNAFAPMLGDKIYLSDENCDFKLNQVNPLCNGVKEYDDLKSIADQ